MKYITPILILALVSQLASALVEAQRIPVVVRTVDVQFHTAGVDREYSHGHWCIDGRSF